MKQIWVETTGMEPLALLRSARRLALTMKTSRSPMKYSPVITAVIDAGPLFRLVAAREVRSFTDE